MSQDKHLDTGRYDPENYWSARARQGGDDWLAAVCVFGATEDENKCADRVQRHLMRSALERADPGKRNVLEYGCGVGRWISFFQERGYSWSGVDISNEMLDIARGHSRDASLRKVEEDRIPYPSESFDLVYSVTVVHHNPLERQEEIVSEMSRVLRDGGHMILIEDLERKSSEFNMFPRDKAGWIALAERHGLTCVWQRGARYWILKHLSAGVLHRLKRSLGARLGRPKQDSPQAKPSLWRKLIGWVDRAIDPYLLPLLPAKYQTTAIMVFSKKG